MRKIFLLITVVAASFFVRQSALAQGTNVTTTNCMPTGQGGEICKLENPIPATEATDIIKIVISAALGIIGSFALLMLVWGGFQWLTSAGNPEKVSAGTQTMVWALIGVMVVLASYVLLSTFLDFLTGKQ